MQGHKLAQFHLGVCYYHGIGVPQDYAQAAHWYGNAARQGASKAQHLLGLLLIEGAQNVQVDPAEGARLLGLSAQQGCAEAIDDLAKHAGVKTVAVACCAGCGKTEGLRQCTKCHVARFCGKECQARVWPTHKPFCRAWKVDAAESRQHDE